VKHSLDKRRRPKRRPVAFETLEPRLLLSADLVPALAPFAHDALPPIPAEHRSLEAMAELPRVVMAQEAARAREVVFVDAGLPDYERLVADVLRATGGERTVDVILLDPSRDGVAQMTEALASRTGLAAVHVVTHGSDGRLQLGGATLDAAALEANSGAIAAWSHAFAADGDLLLYGCNVAETARGDAFIDALALLTGADVAASDDLTGSARLGGDWHLERTTGVIETPIAFSSVLEAWDGVLAQLNWDDAAVDWPAAGLGPTSFAVGGGNVTITVADLAGRLNNGSPDDLTNDQGGLAVTEQGLYVSSTGFLPGESAVITIDFSLPGGVSNVSFTIFDLDRGGGPNFIDVVQASYTASGPVTLGIATSANNTLIAPDTVQGTQSTTSNGPNSGNANAIFTFTGTGISQIKLNYRNAGGATNQSITLHDINFTENAPPSGTNGAVAVNEDATYSFAAADFGFTDPDAGDTLSAVRIDSLPGPGSLVLFGSGAVTAGQVVTIADINAGNLRFTPAANANGAAYASFTFSVRDPGGLFDASPNTLTINVAAVNDAPVASGAATLGGVAEDAASPAGATVAALFGANYSDAADGAGATALAGVAIVGNSASAAQGVWQYSPDGLAWTTIGVALSDASAVTLPGTHLVRFLPAANFNGTPGSLSVRLADGSAGAIGVATGVNLGGAVGGTGNWSATTVALGTSITDVNDAPTFAALANQTLAEDAGAQTLASYTTVAPGGGADEAGQTFSYTVTNDNNALFTLQPTIAADGTLTYTSAANASGTATVTVFVTDSGGTANFGVDTTGPRAFTITATPVADAPTLTVSPATGNEDTAIALSIARSLVDTDGSESLALTVSALPIGATLSDGVNSFTASTGNQSVAISTWNLAALAVTPPVNSDVDFALTVSATATEAANGATAATNASLAVDVVPVNDAPVLGPVALSIDPLQTVTMTGGNMSATDVDNPAASLVFLVAGVTNGQFELASAPGVPVTSFTQAQLASGEVRFVHTNAGFGPSFSIFVSDGAATAGPGVAVVSFRATGADSPSAETAGPGVAVVSFRAPGADSPSAERQRDPTPSDTPLTSGALATSGAGLGGPTVTAFLRTPFTGGDAPTLTFAAAAQEIQVAFARPVRSGAALGEHVAPARMAGLMDFAGDTVPTAMPKVDFAINAVRHDETARSFDVAIDSARITGMALSVGAVWWAARAGGLLASLLASTPAWRHVDPLPVLGRDEDEPEIDWHSEKDAPPEVEKSSEAEMFGEAPAANDPR
jgi:hypothetical protein